MHQLPENMFLLSRRQDLFSNETVKFLDPSLPFLHSKNCGIFTQILQKRPSKTPAVAHLRDT